MSLKQAPATHPERRASRARPCIPTQRGEGGAENSRSLRIARSKPRDGSTATSGICGNGLGRRLPQRAEICGDCLGQSLPQRARIFGNGLGRPLAQRAGSLGDCLGLLLAPEHPGARYKRSGLVAVVAPRGPLRAIRGLRLFSAPPSPLWVGMPTRARGLRPRDADLRARAQTSRGRRGVSGLGSREEGFGDLVPLISPVWYRRAHNSDRLTTLVPGPLQRVAREREHD
jgi:hypothetical protein